MNETWVTVTGNVSTDVTWRRIDSGTVANFRVMSNQRRFDGESGTWQDGKRLGVRVSCWRALARNVQMSITKGDAVVVHGKLFTSEYEVDGVRRSSVEIEATSVGLDLRKVCAKVVVLQEAGAEDGRGPVDVSGLTVVGEEPSMHRYTDSGRPLADDLLEVDDDEFPGREAVAS